MTKDEAFEKFWNTEIVSDVTGNIDTAMWGNIDRNDTAFIFMAGFKACKEALEQPTNMVTIPLDKLEDMQRRLKEQPTQEPVAYFKKWEDKSGEHKDIKFSNSEGYKPLYTHPKEWQGLSNDEIWDIANFLGKNKKWDYPVMFAKTIEQALKEKT